MTVGELLATFNPQPIAILSDTSKLRVRAEVDERDIALAHKDGCVAVSAEAYPGKQFTGQVALVTPMMGRKKVRTADPAERADRDVLEVIIDLNPTDVPLPLGLRVTVQFLQ